MTRDESVRELFEELDVEDELLAASLNLLRLVTKLACRNREALLDLAFAVESEEDPR